MAEAKYSNKKRMSSSRYYILSTASLPFERIGHIPESVEIKVVPFIKIIPRPRLELKPFIAEFASKKQNIVFTSAHAAEIVAECLSNIPDWKIYCIRNETRAMVEKLFGKNTISRYADSALSLSQAIIDDGIRDLVFFCGEQRMDILPDLMKKNGVDITELIVYETRLTPVQLKDNPDAILFFSPTAVKSFFSANTLDAETQIFAMGKTTAAALTKFTSNNIIISEEADKAFVLNMAVEFATSHPTT
jgi:uroporphyrinogen-III synthase